MRPATPSTLSAAAVLHDLRQMLQAEQQALVADDAEALPALAGAKARAFEQLQHAWRATPAAERRALAAGLHAARRANEDNAALAAARLTVYRSRLDGLLALTGPGAAGVYGRRGQLSASRSPRASAAA